MPRSSLYLVRNADKEDSEWYCVLAEGPKAAALKASNLCSRYDEWYPTFEIKTPIHMKSLKNLPTRRFTVYMRRTPSHIYRKTD